MKETTCNFKYVKLPELDFDLSAETTAEGRHYTTPQGNIYPSASTITKSLNHDALVKWRQRVGNKEADRKTKRGADRGTGLHLVCEKYLKGTLSFQEKRSMFPTTKDLFLQTKRELDNHIGLIYAVEQALYSDRLKLAGRTDAVVTWDGKLCILDFKTSAKIKPIEWITNYFVQCTAYAEMFEERTGLKVEGVVLVMALEEENRAMVYNKPKEDYIQIMHQCLDAYYAENSQA